MTAAELPPETLERLEDTIERAAKLSPYYREAFSEIDIRVRSIEDLRKLPLLSRDTMFSNAFHMMATGSVPVSVGMSGGTTSQVDGVFRQLITFKNDEESRSRRASVDESYRNVEVRPLLLHLMNLGHGYDTSAALEGIFQMAIERNFHVQAILSLLRHEFSFPGYTSRIKAMVGALRLIKALTMLCVEGGIASSEFDISLISSSSNHLTSRWRILLEQFWNADVDETYGLSEVPGLRARRCVDCGHFHFSPSAFVEVLGVEEDEPVELGVGRVVATSMLPNAALQPIIRYDTADLIDVRMWCSTRNALGFEFLGRRRDVVVAPVDGAVRCVVSPIGLNEVLDSFPDIATVQYGFAQQLDICSHGVGYQKWATRRAADGQELVLDIELKWSPFEFATRAGELRDTIRQEVLKAAPILSDLVVAADLCFDVVLHEPGTTKLKALV